MKLKDWFRVQKEKRAERRRERLERKLGRDAVLIPELDADTEGVEQPESRFTEEYREFLEKREEAVRDDAPVVKE